MGECTYTARGFDADAHVDTAFGIDPDVHVAILDLHSKSGNVRNFEFQTWSYIFWTWIAVNT